MACFLPFLNKSINFLKFFFQTGTIVPTGSVLESAFMLKQDDCRRRGRGNSVPRKIWTLTEEEMNFDWGRNERWLKGRNELWLKGRNELWLRKNIYKDRNFTKGLKNKWKWFFLLLSIPSMFMTLCHTLVSYLISFVYICFNFVLFREEAELLSRPPHPSSSLLVEKLLENKYFRQCFYVSRCQKFPNPSTIRYINR